MTLRDGGENRGSSEGLQTKGFERVGNGVEGHRARENERMESKGVRQGRSKRMEDVVEGRQTRGSRQSRLAWHCGVSYY